MYEADIGKSCSNVMRNGLARLCAGMLFHRHAFAPTRFSTGTLFHRHAFPTASFSTGDAIGNASPPATLCAGPKLAPLLSA